MVADQLNVVYVACTTQLEVPDSHVHLSTHKEIDCYSTVHNPAHVEVCKLARCQLCWFVVALRSIQDKTFWSAAGVWQPQ